MTDHFLGKLIQAAGFISVEQIGRERHCNLNQEGFNKIEAWLTTYGL
jgi:hypothetical protein